MHFFYFNLIIIIKKFEYLIMLKTKIIKYCGDYILVRLKKIQQEQTLEELSLKVISLQTFQYFLEHAIKEFQIVD